MRVIGVRNIESWCTLQCQVVNEKHQALSIEWALITQHAVSHRTYQIMNEPYLQKEKNSDGLSLYGLNDLETPRLF